MSNKTSIDKSELAKFSKTDDEWWDKDGEFKLLHEINPIRIQYISQQILKHFAIKGNMKLLSKLKLIDIGCGGGLVCVPMNEFGVRVTGLDANKHNIEAASNFAKCNNLDIEYINSTVEEHIKSSKKYDIVLCLEVIEHVANPEEFVKNISKLVASGGILIFSTINRTAKSYALAIIMAEYVLGWIPKKTHDYSKFVKPSEFVRMLQETKMCLVELKGLSMSAVSQQWQLSEDIDVNYFAVFSE